jgi:hypothetical protein
LFKVVVAVVERLVGFVCEVGGQALVSISKIELLGFGFG